MLRKGIMPSKELDDFVMGKLFGSSYLELDDELCKHPGELKLSAKPSIGLTRSHFRNMIETLPPRHSTTGRHDDFHHSYLRQNSYSDRVINVQDGPHVP